MNVQSPFRAIMEKVSNRLNVPFVPVHKSLAKQMSPDKLVQSNDRYHLNSLGHQMAATLIFDSMVENGIFIFP